MDKKTQLLIFEIAKKWLQQNPEWLTEKEKVKFKAELFEYLTSHGNTISDEVFDFFIDSCLIKDEDRHTEFFKYLKKKYPDIPYYLVLDVGAGRMCHLSEKLAKRGASVVAMDPNIRLCSIEAKDKNILQIKKEFFICDQFAPLLNSGTDITTYDLIVGLEPCMATEHIIRQSLKYDKPFDVLLCTTEHNALNGKKFKYMEDWYSYLKSISKYLNLVEYHGSTIITNNNTKLPEDELTL